MVDQAKVAETNGPAESPPRAAARNLAELLHDVLTLAELQGELLAVELREVLQKMVAPTIVMVCGIVLALSCLPIALVCVALVLTETTALSPAQAFLVTLLGGIVVAASLVLGSIWYLRKSVRLLERTRTEWSMNMRWIRGVLKRLGSAGSHAKFGAETGYRW